MTERPDNPKRLANHGVVLTVNPRRVHGSTPLSLGQRDEYMYQILETAVPLVAWALIQFVVMLLLAALQPGKMRRILITAAAVLFIVGPHILNMASMDAFARHYRNMDHHPYPSWDIAQTYRFILNDVLLYAGMASMAVIFIEHKRKRKGPTTIKPLKSTTKKRAQAENIFGPENRTQY